MINWLLEKWADYNQKKSIVINKKTGTKRVRGRFFFNPLTDYPRNLPCWCGSQRKAKICCLPKVKETCSFREAQINKKYIQYIKKVHNK